MAILTSALAAVLILVGFAGLAMSVDLIPTEVGLFYGISGVVFSSSGAIVLAVAALIAKLDRIVAPKPKVTPPSVVETAIEAPVAPGPKEVGRYVAGGTEYAIFADGAIEAETAQGRRRFGSMAEFRGYVETNVEAN